MIHLKAIVPNEYAKKRLDQVLPLLFPEYSRSLFKTWIEKGYVLVDGKSLRVKDKLQGGECISINAEIVAKEDWKGEAIPLDVVYQDQHLIVINKPHNFVVHPAAGNYSGTLVNALLNIAPELETLPRAGVVHRLDKDTTGLMVVARTLEAHHQLIQQLQKRSVKRLYEAVVQGVLVSGGTVDAPIGRHPTERKRMAVVMHGKPAITHYRIGEKFTHHTHLKIQIETGRTHQIRVHMNYIKYPVVGDRTYGGRFRLPPDISDSLSMVLREFPRQALHAKCLGLIHPKTGQEMEWQVPLPNDMEVLLQVLRQEDLK